MPAKRSSLQSVYDPAAVRAPSTLGGHQNGVTPSVCQNAGWSGSDKENNIYKENKYLSGAAVVAAAAAVVSASVLLASVQLRVESGRGMDFVGGAG